MKKQLRMTFTEHKAAALALMRWFESQDMYTADATVVMAYTLACIAMSESRDPEQSIDLVMELVRRSVRKMMTAK